MKLQMAAAFLLFTASPALAAHSQQELAGITDRGRQLAEYDQAAWHATDAVQAVADKNDPNVRSYIAQKVNGKWIVDFGKLDAASVFLTAYEASETTDLAHFSVTHFTTPRAQSGYLTAVANAFQVAAGLRTGQQAVQRCGLVLAGRHVLRLRVSRPDAT